MAFWRDDGYPAPGQVSEEEYKLISAYVRAIGSAARETLDKIISDSAIGK